MNLTERAGEAVEQEKGQGWQRQGQGLLIHHQAKLRTSTPQPSLEDDLRRAYTLRYKLIPQTRKEYKRLAKILDGETFVQMSRRMGLAQRAAWRSQTVLKEAHPEAWQALQDRKVMLRRKRLLNVQYRDYREEWKTLTSGKLCARHGVRVSAFRRCAEYIRWQVKDAL